MTKLNYENQSKQKKNNYLLIQMLQILKYCYHLVIDWFINIGSV